MKAEKMWLNTFMKSSLRFASWLLAPLAILSGWLVIFSAVYNLNTVRKTVELDLWLIFSLPFNSVDEISVGRVTGELFGSLSTPFLGGAIGAALVVFGRRLWLKTKFLSSKTDSSPPVVYLRAFDNDKDMSKHPISLGRLFTIKSEEEQLISALREIGPVFAIGKPGEVLPFLGASRLYFNDEEWQSQVLNWFRQAALVVINLPMSPIPSQGILWELSSAINIVDRNRLVFLFPKEGHTIFNWFNKILQEHNIPPFPIGRALPRVYGSKISGLAYFASNGEPDFIPLTKPPLLNRTFSSPLIRVYRLALKPIITRLKGEFAPFTKEHGEVIATTCWILLFALIILRLVFLLPNSTPWQREVLMLGSRIHFNNELPEKLRQAVLSNDLEALGPNWLQAGLPYLSDAEMFEFITNQERILLTASQQECAALVNGQKLEPSAMENLLNKIAESDRKFVTLYFKIVERIIIKSNNFSKAHISGMSEEELVDAEDLFFHGMSRETRHRYEIIAKDIPSASADDICWQGRDTFARLRQMGMPMGSKLYRMWLRNS